MKRPCALLLAAAVAVSATAGPLDVNGSFDPGGPDGLPRGWKFHTYAGYRPFAKVELTRADGGAALTLSDATGPSGGALMTAEKFAAVSGDVVKVSCELKGTGVAAVELNHYAEDGGWNQPQRWQTAQPVKLTSDWRRHVFTLRVGDGKKRTGRIMPVLSCRKGSVASFRNLSLDLCRTLRSGSWDFEPMRTLAEEDFERETAAPRAGAPEIVSGIVSDGLLSRTRRGVYTAEKSRILLGAKGVRLAADDRLGSLRGSFRLYSLSNGAKLVVRLAADGRRQDFEMPETLAALTLPADVVFRAGRSGEYVWTARSLVDGGRADRSGDESFLRTLTNGFDCALGLLAAGKSPARTDVDNLVLAEDRAVARRPDLPAVVTPEPTFDPSAKGWKKVFEDEFEGPAGARFDESKWYVPFWRKDNGCAQLDGKGHLDIRCEFVPGGTNLQSIALWSVPSWRYGFFEARVRFTRNNGWWAAFWLYGSSNRVANEDGGEIDIFEDYHTRRKREPGKSAPIALDHNLHMSYRKDLKSYNRNSFTPGPIEEFHTIGCKWTPFEISLYMDGRLMSNEVTGADSPTVTFDGFRTATAADPHVVRTDGEELVLDVSVTGGAKIEEAYLFDAGSYLMRRTNPPWRFRFPFSKERYRDTRYAVPGRQGVQPDWDRMLHSFSVYVRDAAGRIGVTDEPVRYLSSVAVDEAAGAKEVQTVPGKLLFGQDKTGYVRHALTGDVRTCEVDVARDGDFVGRFDYCSGNDFPNKVIVLADGRQVATALAPGAPGRDWDCRLTTDPVTFRLAAGRHKIAFVVIGYLHLGGFSVISR